MNKYKIYLSPPSQSGHEWSSVQGAIASNWLAPVGPAIDQFEHDLSELHEGKQVLALSSGTAAIHLALQLCGVTKGDEVIVATHTHNATVNPIIYQNAIPIFVDCETDSWNISPYHMEKAIEDRIEKGKKPKAILIVHLYGMPAKLNAILKIAQAFDIPVIEDAAESLGSTFNQKPLGVFGEYGVLSFNGNKIVTTSGGGALITSNKKIRERALFLATQARDDAPHFQHSEIGYNYRISNILAALGSAQLKDLDNRVEKRRSIFTKYVAYFKQLNAALGEDIISWVNDPENGSSNRWLSTFLIKPAQGVNRETWRLKLQEAGIESRPLWKPMHIQPVFNSYPYFGEGNAEHIFEMGICLPSGSDLSRLEQEEICNVIAGLYERKVS